jgi:hypothetical protein
VSNKEEGVNDVARDMYVMFQGTENKPIFLLEVDCDYVFIYPRMEMFGGYSPPLWSLQYRCKRTSTMMDFLLIINKTTFI